LTDCAGSCVDVASDPAHCGGCGLACGANQICSAGSCACPAGLALCDGACVDTQSSGANCGGCGNACPTGQVCNAGICSSSCAAGLTQCGQDCVDTSTNLAHCGGCDAACVLSGALAACVGGSCVIQSCHGGFVDLDQLADNGCEYACIPVGVEECNGLDDDCNGQIDDGLSCAGDQVGTGGASATDSGGTTAAGGGGEPAAAGGAATGSYGVPENDSGCGCSVPGSTHRSYALAGLLFGALALRRRRLRRPA
jgi:MYXO-CTERM domain-containing protein